MYGIQFYRKVVPLMPINSYENYALSWRPVKERLTRPYYQSLVQQLEADILSGALQKM